MILTVAIYNFLFFYPIDRPTSTKVCAMENETHTFNGRGLFEQSKGSFARVVQIVFIPWRAHARICVTFVRWNICWPYSH